MKKINSALCTAFLLTLGTPTVCADERSHGWQIHKMDKSLTGRARYCKALSPSVDLPAPPVAGHSDNHARAMRLYFELNVLVEYGSAFLTPIIESPQAQVAYGNDYASLFEHIAAHSSASELAYYFPQEAPRINISQQSYSVSIAGEAYREFRLVENGRQLSSLASIQRLTAAEKAGEKIYLHHRLSQPTSNQASNEVIQIQLPVQGLEQAYIDVIDCIRVENRNV